MAADRLQALLAQTAVTGIDFVSVQPGQTTLDVHFHVDPTALVPPWTAAVDPATVLVRSTSERSAAPQVPVSQASWASVGGKTVLRLQTAFPGDFSRYTLRLPPARLDRRYNDLPFSFKVDCPSDLDCEIPEPPCATDGPDWPTDYLARDFWSLRRSLLDFASQRYPRYKDRLEADVGVMLLEVMAAVGDEMAYYQDRVARQAALATATERRSVRQLARLVDYELDDGAAAFAWLDFTVADGAVVEIPAGTDVWASGADGLKVVFEVGRGLDDALAVPVVTFQVRGEWNALQPHLWDEDETCLPCGSTALWVVGHLRASLFPVGAASWRWLVLRTFPTDPARPARTHLVRVRGEDLEEDRDHVFGVDVTLLRWDAAFATPFDLDLEVLMVRANLVPATAGVTSQATFTIGAAAATEQAPAAIEREGPAGEARPVVYRHSLPGSDALALCWTESQEDPAQGPVPEVRLFEQAGLVRGTEWQWRRSLLGVASSDPEDRHFTLEDGTWGEVLHWDRPTERIAHRDYRSGQGFTLRFGGGEFGRIPAKNTVFQAWWRLGGGARGNLAPDTLTHTELTDPDVLAVTNPLGGRGGRDPQTLDEVRALAPEAFRAVTHRAVRPEDYALAVERLPEVQRAGAELRWTGSWLTLFATPDPIGTVTLSEPLRDRVQDQLDRFRQAGRAAHVRRPVYAFLDLEVTLCLEPWAYRGEVSEQVLVALFGVRPCGAPRQAGFFDPDHFTFGTPLERSRLEAALHAVAGVRAVKSMRIRRRGHFPLRDFVEPYYAPGSHEVLGLYNDPLFPERGSLRLVTEGGA